MHTQLGPQPPWGPAPATEHGGHCLPHESCLSAYTCSHELTLVHTHVPACSHTRACMHTLAHACAHSCTRLLSHSHLHVGTCSRLCTHPCTHLLSHTCMHTLLHACAHTHVPACFLTLACAHLLTLVHTLVTCLFSHTCASLHSHLHPWPHVSHADTLVRINTRMRAHTTLKQYSPAVSGSDSVKPWGGTGVCCQVPCEHCILNKICLNELPWKVPDWREFFHSFPAKLEFYLSPVFL